jgi:hypothetical protein
MTATITRTDPFTTLTAPLSVSATARGVCLAIRTPAAVIDLHLSPSDLCGLMEMYGQVAREDEYAVTVRIAE